MNDIDIAWASGILEGEGSFTLKGANGLSARCTMTDLDIIERIQKIFGGSIYPQEKRKEHWKDAWIWNITGDNAETCMKAVLPHMGQRRSAKIRAILEVREQYSLRRKTDEDRRKRAIEDYLSSGKSMRQISREYGISRKTLVKYT